MLIDYHGLMLDHKMTPLELSIQIQKELTEFVYEEGKIDGYYKARYEDDEDDVCRL
jgi:hypothetical protein